MNDQKANTHELRTLVTSYRSLISGASKGKWLIATKPQLNTQVVLYGVSGLRVVEGENGENGIGYEDVMYILSTQPTIMSIILNELDKCIKEVEMYRATTDCLNMPEPKEISVAQPPKQDIVFRQARLIKLLEAALNRGDNVALTTEARTAKVNALKALAAEK